VIPATQVQWERFELVLARCLASAAGACREQCRSPRRHALRAADLRATWHLSHGGAAGGGSGTVARLCARVIATRQLQPATVSYGATVRAWPGGVGRALASVRRHAAFAPNHGAVEVRTALPDPRAGDDGHDDD
jgi:hypothetical protein